ncbi:regulator of chromosome condensation, RCC1 [Bdellovibrio bacteriovorus W]|nr:regulator of chromosome condensation, RCC1 [Bdellovibrio bacteriovorus W]
MKKKQLISNDEIVSSDRRDFLLSAGRLGALGIAVSILSPKDKTLAFRNTLGFWKSKTQVGLFHWGAPISATMIKSTLIDPNDEWHEVFLSTVSIAVKSSYAIKTDGTLWVWGENKFGQLGLGHQTDISSPIQMGTAKWKSIGVSQRGASGIQENGSLWAWGASAFGENGIFYDRPHQLPDGAGEGWKDVWADYFSTFAIKTDGTFWAWGSGTIVIQSQHIPIQLNAQKWKKVTGGRTSTPFILVLNEDGSLWGMGINSDGIFGAESSSSTLTKISNGPWIDVSAGGKHILALKNDGTLWAWGNNSYGQLGDGTYESKSSPVQVSFSGSIKSFISSENRNFILTNSGEIWGWGHNAYNSLGVEYFSPVLVPSARPWKVIAGNSSTTMAIATDGTLWGWGLSNNGGVLGKSSTSVYSQTMISDAKWKDIAVSHTAYGIQTDGSLWTWGWGSNGELGDGTKAHRSSPVQISSESWRSVSVGTYANAAIKDDNTLWVSGANSYGTLGVGDTNSRSHLTQVGGAEWRSVDVCKSNTTSAHMIALKTDGSLWTWGNNMSGQMGDGTTTNKSSPIQVGSATDWVKVLAGSTYSLALKSDNTLWFIGSVALTSSSTFSKILGEWTDISVAADSFLAKKSDGSIWGVGKNNMGAMGTTNLYSTVSIFSPVKVHDAEVGLKFHCQAETNFFLKADGSLWGTGSNTEGNLGLRYNEPLKVVDGVGWRSVSASSSRSVGVKANGTLWLWGHTGQNDIALPRNSMRHLLQIRPETDWSSVEDIYEHIVCLKTDGSRWLWGSNLFGELGNGSFENLSSPIQISGGGWSKISSGRNFTLAIKSNGTLWSWGDNTYGSLGQLQKTPLLIDSNVWKQVFLSYRNGAGVRSNGTLWVWGSDMNGAGALGGPDRARIRQLGTQSDWSSVQLGGDINRPIGVALKEDKTLWAWGSGGSLGQMGLGTISKSSSPMQISGSWKNFSVGKEHVLALATDGTLWSWGANSSRQLGGGLTSDKHSLPNQVNAQNWRQVFASNDSSMAIHAEGSLWAWGSGLSGVTGLGTSMVLSSPTQIGSDKNWFTMALGYTHSLGIRKK